jgi:biotin operon repressor
MNAQTEVKPARILGVSRAAVCQRIKRASQIGVGPEELRRAG